MQPSQDFERQLAQLKQDFLRQLPQRGAEIGKLWRDLSSTPFDQKELQQLYRLVHNLAGSGGAFDYPDITHAARAAAVPMRPLLKMATPEINKQIFPQLDQLIQQLVAACGAEKKGGAHSQHVDFNTDIRPGQLGHKLIIVVAPPGAGRTGLEQRFTAFGYPVRGYSSLKAAIASLREQSPHAVIVDADLPELATTAQLEKLPLEKQFGAPIFMLSNKVEFAIRLASVRAGVTGFFSQPVDMANLISFIETIAPEHEQEPFRVLVIDDDPRQADYHALVLQRTGMQTKVLYEPSMIFDALAEFDPELLLFDVYMPGCSGVELAKIVRQIPTYLSVPIVYLSVERDVDIHLDSMLMGADDFLTKPIEPQQLVTSVRIRASRARKLKWLMVRDSLTRLFNHGVTVDRLIQALALAQRQKSPLCVAMLDLDNFKSVNDAYGHPTGDKVLITLSQLLQQRLRNSDIIGRYGGEEFLVIFPDTPLKQARAVLDDLRDIFNAMPFASGKGAEQFSVSFSCGIAAMSEHCDAHSLIETADQLLYQAKMEGKNRIVLDESNG